MNNLLKIIIISTSLTQFVFSKEMLIQKDTHSSFWDRCQLEFGINQFYYNYNGIFNDEFFDFIGIDTVIGEMRSNEYGYTVQPQLDFAFTFNPKSKSIVNILNLHLAFGWGMYIYEGG